MTPIISVIVPVYNVSDYIVKCVESICNQSFINFEIILVDDASTDNSLIKINETLTLKKSDSFSVQIITHTFNKGVVEARRTGLESSGGEYILFVDGDDYIEPEMLEQLYKCANSSNADIITSDMFLEFEKRQEYFTEYLSANLDMCFYDITFGSYFSHSLCNKLVKRDLYIKVYSQLNYKMTYYEDKFVCIRLYFYANKIVKINEAFYHYVKYNQCSATHSVSKSTFESVKYYWTELEQFLESNLLKENYLEQLNTNKIKDVIKLLLATNSYTLINEYALLFEHDEVAIKQNLRTGEKIFLTFIRKKLFIIAYIVKQLIVFKNKRLLGKMPKSVSDILV